MSTWEFLATPQGWVANLESAERAALCDVIDDVTALLGADDAPWLDEEPGPWPRLRPEDQPLAPPADPAVRRLLPDASHADPDVAAEFRRLTEDDLRTTKIANLRTLRTALEAPTPQVRVDPAVAPAVAAALTDLRLVLAERLGIRSEEDADAAYMLVLGGGPLDVTDPDAVARRFLATVSALLGVLQESLMDLMLEELPDDVLEDLGEGLSGLLEGGDGDGGGAGRSEGEHHHEP